MNVSYVPCHLHTCVAFLTCHYLLQASEPCRATKTLFRTPALHHPLRSDEQAVLVQDQYLLVQHCLLY